MKKLLCSLLFLLCLFFAPTNAMEQQDLRHALANLSSQLERLQLGFSKDTTISVEPTGNIAQGLPYELVYTIIEDIIPASLSEKPAAQATDRKERELILQQQKVTFQAIIRNIAAMERTSKEYREVLNNPIYNKIIVKKLFSLIRPSLFGVLNLPKTPSNDSTILAIIRNILYYVSLLRNSATPPQKIDEAIRYIVNAGINANSFVDNDRLLFKAIEKDLPDTVDYLIENGADINLKNQNDLLPFNSAFNNSPQLALRILNDRKVDFDLIKDTAQFNKIFLKNWGQINVYVDIVKILFENSFSPNQLFAVVPGIKYYRDPSITLFGFIVSVFPSYGDKHKLLELIKEMLDQGANIHKSVALVEHNTTRTPLEIAEQEKNLYPELYDLLKKYDKGNP